MIFASLMTVGLTLSIVASSAYAAVTPVEEYDYDDYDNAIIEYSRIIFSDFDVSKTYIFTDQDIISAFLNRGKVYYNRQEYAKAVWDFSMILKMEPRNKRALLCRAKAYEVFAPDLARADYEAAEKFGTEYFVVAKKVQRN